MKHDFYQSILFKNGSSANSAELESQTLPCIVAADGHRLKNYKIYGADGGVGNYDSETGKYVIPVTIAGKNVLKNTAVNTSSVIDAVVNADGSVTFNGTATESVDFYIAGNYYSVYNFLREEDTYIIRCDTNKQTRATFFVGYANPRHGSNISVNGESSISTGALSYAFIRIPAGTTLDNVTFYPMICSAGFSNHDFEQYYTQTTNVILDEPLVEDECVDFREQKRYNADETTEIISLSAISTIDGTNIISVNTTIQPSKLYLQGDIQEIVLSQVQTLNSVSFDRNVELDEIDRELALDVMPVGGVEDGA